MDIVSAGIKLVQAVRFVVSRIKGESQLVISCRQLMHTCQLYEEALGTLHSSLLAQHKQDLERSQKRNVQTEETKTALDFITDQVNRDCALLQNILTETQKVSETTERNSLYYNALLSALGGRVERIKRLEEELMNRVQLITAFMMKDVWRREHRSKKEVVDELGDVDGALFWIGHFSDSVREVSFESFVQAYSVYISQTFICRPLERRVLAQLLEQTLIEDTVSIGSKPAVTAYDSFTSSVSPRSSSAVIITLHSFKLWLNRFGPLKETLYKAAAVVNPITGAAMPWFQRNLNRTQSTQALQHYVDKYLTGTAAQHSGGIPTHCLFIVRYSTDPKNHFVITVKPPHLVDTQHYVVVNGPMGYAIQGTEVNTGSFAHTLVDCVQRNILDKLFNLHPNYQANPVTLSRHALDQWESLIAQASSTLPMEHYRSIDELNAASNLIIEGIDKVSASLSATFADVPMADNNATEGSSSDATAVSNTSKLAHDESQDSFKQNTPAAEATSLSNTQSNQSTHVHQSVLLNQVNQMYQNNHAVHAMSSSLLLPSIPSEEAAMVGSYLVRHGLQLLRQVNRFSDQDVATVLAMLASRTPSANQAD